MRMNTSILTIQGVPRLFTIRLRLPHDSTRDIEDLENGWICRFIFIFGKTKTDFRDNFGCLVNNVFTFYYYVPVFSSRAVSSSHTNHCGILYHPYKTCFQRGEGLGGKVVSLLAETKVREAIIICST